MVLFFFIMELPEVSRVLVLETEKQVEDYIERRPLLETDKH